MKIPAQCTCISQVGWARLLCPRGLTTINEKTSVVSHYRRSQQTGANYFFTLATYRRQNILTELPIRNALREAIHSVRLKRPFTIDAWVLLPDHLHCIWTLPADDADFSSRWSMIKRQVSIACGEKYKRENWLSNSKQKHRESTLL